MVKNNSISGLADIDIRDFHQKQLVITSPRLYLDDKFSEGR